MAPIDQILIIAALLLLAGVLASKLSSQLGVPALLLFLLTGMLAGTEGFGGIPFDDKGLTQTLGIVALSFILFAGGMGTRWPETAGVLWRGLSLSTLGVFLTAAITGVFAAPLFGFSWQEGLLLGAIMSSTDAAAVFSILRSHGVSLKGTNRPLLELESGSNDPMAVFLTLALIRTIKQPDGSLFDLGIFFVLQMAIGAALGCGIGKLSVILVNRIRLQTEGLYPVITLSIVLLTYGAASVLGGNGFLAVYLAGIVMGNSDFIHKRSLIRFHDGLSWLLQIAMFVILGLLVFPSHLVPVIGKGLLLASILTFIARPVSVFLSLAFARMGIREKLLVSWVGLRGAAPIVLATFPFVAGVPNSELYFNVVFFVVLSSVLLQGTSITYVARRLGLEAPLSVKRAYPLEYVSSGSSNSEMVEIPIPDNSPFDGRQVLDLGLPKGALIVLLSRDDDFLVPRGGTVVQSGDVLLVLAERPEIEEVRRLAEPSADPESAPASGGDR